MGGDQGGLLQPPPATTTRDRIRYITVRNTTAAHLGVLRRGQTPEKRCQLINRRRQSDISKFLSKLVAKDERSDSISGEFLQTLHFLPLNLVDRILFGWFSKERTAFQLIEMKSEARIGLPRYPKCCRVLTVSTEAAIFQ